MLLVSTLFALWARLSLGVMWTSSAVVKRDHQLPTAGPYAITRHPIYTGVLGRLRPGHWPARPSSRVS